VRLDVEHCGQTGSHDSLESEDADVLFTLAALCNELDIDLADPFLSTRWKICRTDAAVEKAL
jgi:NTP pyrophosphatase (non-canonical NTP hydrolase)